MWAAGRLGTNADWRSELARRRGARIGIPQRRDADGAGFCAMLSSQAAMLMPSPKMSRIMCRLFDVFHGALMTFRPLKLTKISMRESKIEQTTVASVRETCIKRCDCGSSSLRS
jgi:hypothetical protein